MKRFDRVLRRVDRRLEGPEPLRSRILLEMAADLDDLYAAYRGQGLDEDEARRKAVQWIEPSPEAADSLRSVHASWIERLLDRAEGPVRGWIEIGALGLISLAATGAGVATVLRAGLFSSPSPGVWAVSGLAAAGLGAGVAQAYLLFARGDRLGPGWRRGLDAVLVAAAGSALAGLLAGGVRITTAGAGIGALWSNVAAASALAALGLIAALLLSLVWLALRVRAGAVERARDRLRAAVDGDHPDRPEASLQRETTR